MDGLHVHRDTEGDMQRRQRSRGRLVGANRWKGMEVQKYKTRISLFVSWKGEFTLDEGDEVWRSSSHPSLPIGRGGNWERELCFMMNTNNLDRLS